MFLNIVLLFFLISISFGNSYSQTKTNVDIITNLVNQSLISIAQNWEGHNPAVEIIYTSQNNIKFFKDHITAVLKNNGTNVITDKDKSDLILNYTINSVNINYNETFRDGLFGDYLVEREADLNCSFNIEVKNEVIAADNFKFSLVDTVKYDEIKNLENNSIPFSQAEIPPEPFFSSLLEPVIAVVTAVVTIFLFFTVRSK